MIKISGKFYLENSIFPVNYEITENIISGEHAIKFSKILDILIFNKRKDSDMYEVFAENKIINKMKPRTLEFIESNIKEYYDTMEEYSVNFLGSFSVDGVALVLSEPLQQVEELKGLLLRDISPIIRSGYRNKPGVFKKKSD